MKKLTQDFENYFCNLAQSNWGSWPDAKEWPACGVSYSAYQESIGDKGAIRTVVKFDQPVEATTGHCGNKFTAAKWATGQKFAPLR